MCPWGGRKGLCVCGFPTSRALPDSLCLSQLWIETLTPALASSAQHPRVSVITARVLLAIVWSLIGLQPTWINLSWWLWAPLTVHKSDQQEISEAWQSSLWSGVFLEAPVWSFDFWALLLNENCPKLAEKVAAAGVLGLEPGETAFNCLFPISLAPADRGAAGRAVGAGLWQHRGAEEHVPAHRRGAGGTGSVSTRRPSRGHEIEGQGHLTGPLTSLTVTWLVKPKLFYL